MIALALSSPRWSDLEHAYGNASDIPGLLAQLSTLPSAKGDAEPWLSLWSALAHQGDVYSASFAAVPHVVQAVASDPARASFDYFQFPAWVEICRVKQGKAVPSDLLPAYTNALAQLPEVVAAAASVPWDNEVAVSALAAIAVAKNMPALGEVILELSPGVVVEFESWLHEN